MRLLHVSTIIHKSSLLSHTTYIVYKKVKCCPFITLCLESIGIDRAASESCESRDNFTKELLENDHFILFLNLMITCAVKLVLSGQSKIDKTKVLMKKCSLKQVKSVAVCSPWSILQYF